MNISRKNHVFFLKFSMLINPNSVFFFFFFFFFLGGGELLFIVNAYNYKLNVRLSLATVFLHKMKLLLNLNKSLRNQAVSKTRRTPRRNTRNSLHVRLRMNNHMTTARPRHDLDEKKVVQTKMATKAIPTRQKEAGHQRSPAG